MVETDLSDGRQSGKRFEVCEKMLDGVFLETLQAPGVYACRAGRKTGLSRFAQHTGRYRNDLRIVHGPVGVDIYVWIGCHRLLYFGIC